MTDQAGFVVDDLALADLPRCAELEAHLFAGESPWPLEGFVSELAAPHNRYFALRDSSGGGELAGYAGISLLGPPGEHECEIHTIAVAPEHRGRGGGRILLDRLLEVADAQAAPVFLEVRTDNTVALTLYGSVGFTVAGVRRNYYQPSGADAYVMARPPSDKLKERDA
ncbi:MAG: ribosomal protein S18-alanine N-acetyltransferase [Gordonia sp. (in: high G+C Gram-positive bacteria)]|uniref:ribosomal protein S18-alanine N-acetyltransferase n=1 Tax=Gordonia sp. (in: high G+C Gram-positive bacteria) TaxID=84139 RepID=UPI0039E5B835